MKYITLCLLIFSTFVYATPETCQFKLDCKNGKKSFSVEFKSKLNSCPEDDTQLTFSAEGKSVPLKLKENWYFQTSHISKTQNSICRIKGELAEFTAYAVNSKQAFFFIGGSGRPGYDTVSVLFLDTDTGKVLDFKALGESKNSGIAVLKEKQGFKIRIVRASLSFHDKVTCDCDAPFVDDWMYVYPKNGKVVSEWLVK